MTGRVPPPLGTPQWHPDWWPDWARSRWEKRQAERVRLRELRGPYACAWPSDHDREDEPLSQHYEQHQIDRGYETVRNLLRVLKSDPEARVALRRALDELGDDA